MGFIPPFDYLLLFFWMPGPVAPAAPVIDIDTGLLVPEEFFQVP
jgi:hypothetical protein